MKAAICRYDGKTFTVFTKNEHQAEVKPGVYLEQNRAIFGITPSMASIHLSNHTVHTVPVPVRFK
jgi:hypothetical protein